MTQWQEVTARGGAPGVTAERLGVRAQVDPAFSFPRSAILGNSPPRRFSSSSVGTQVPTNPGGDEVIEEAPLRPWPVFS